jgi:ceramide glucosyltransferase
MKSTRYSRPKGHLGTGLTFATPFGVLGLLASVALGDSPLGWWLFAAAWANRVIQALAVGWGIVRDPRLLALCWLYPLRDLLGFFIWVGSFASRSFFWRGEVYRFSDGGKIVPQDRPAESAAAQRL